MGECLGVCMAFVQELNIPNLCHMAGTMSVTYNAKGPGRTAAG